jgi:hypothetical protein
MLTFIEARMRQGALSVTEPEIMAAVIPTDNPELRSRPNRYALSRLRVRHYVNAIDDPAGVSHYFIGDHPTSALRSSLGLDP